MKVHTEYSSDINPGDIYIIKRLADFINPQNVESFIGNTYLLTECYNDFGGCFKTQEVYRIEGYEIALYDLYGPIYLTPKGFYSAHYIYDRDSRTGNHIYAYEKTNTYKTLKDAIKVAKKHNAWIHLIAVQCPYDDRREPHYTNIDISEIMPAKISRIN